MVGSQTRGSGTEAKQLARRGVTRQQMGTSSTTTAEEEANGGEKEDSDRAAAVGFMAADPEVGARVAAAIGNAPAILAGVHRSAPAETVRSAAR